MFQISSTHRSFQKFCLVATALGLVLGATGCGLGTIAADSGPAADSSGSNVISGYVHAGATPINGASLTVYVTNSSGYGGTSSVLLGPIVSGSDGSFSFTLPTATAINCPTGEFAYLVSYGGNTGANTANTAALLVLPVGLCSSLYTTTGTTGNYTNTYNGPAHLTINEVTTAATAYALRNFISIGSGGVVNIGAPANNHSTASATSAAGLAHAFQNALSLVNISTGGPYATMAGAATGATIPAAEISLIGNIVAACVNSSGPTGTNSATANDGSGCGKLFSLVTPPQTGATPPSNTLQALMDLAKYPNPSVNTWNSGCTTASGSGAGTTTATSCLFGLASGQSQFPNALTAAPPDWSLAVVYPTGFGAGTGPGLTYPTYVALDDQDNVYILNYDAATATKTNIISFTYNGTSNFSTATDSTHKTIRQIGTDTAGHVFGGDSATGVALIYSTGDGSLKATVTSTTVMGVTTSLSAPSFTIADPFNNIYVGSSGSGTNLRFISSGTFAVKNLGTGAATATNGTAAMAFDANLDLYVLGGASSSAPVYLVSNTNSSLTSAPTYSSDASTTLSSTGSTGSAYGIVGTGSNNAYVVDTVGVTPVTKASASSVSAGSAVTIPGRTTGMTTETFTPRFLAIDGNGWLYTPDFANAGAVTGVAVYDTVDSLVLGTYEGCAVVGTVSPACATTTSQAPIYSPHAIAIDSSGDIWVPSASSSTAVVTELIGAAAPTWPALSVAKFGLPQ